MATCPRCRSVVAADARICKECGAQLDPSLSTEPADAATLTQPPAADVADTVEAAAHADAEVGEIVGAGASSVPSVEQLPAVPPPLEQPTHAPAPTQARGLAGSQPRGRQRIQWLVVLIALGALGVIMIFACIGLLFLTFNSSGSAIFAGPTATTVPKPTRTPRPTEAGQGGVVSTPTPSGNVLLRDDFSRSDSTDLVGEDDEARYAFEDGAYAITVKVEQLGVWRKFKDSYGDVAAQVDTSLVDGPDSAAAGLIFRYQDNKNFYIFNVAGNGQYNLEVRKNDLMTTLIGWTPSPAIKSRDDINTLRVEVVGSSMTLYVNGVKLEETKDTTFTKGQLAIAVNTFDQGGAKVTFDNLLVEGK